MTFIISVFLLLQFGLLLSLYCFINRLYSCTKVHREYQAFHITVHHIIYILYITHRNSTYVAELDLQLLHLRGKSEVSLFTHWCGIVQ